MAGDSTYAFINGLPGTTDDAGNSVRPANPNIVNVTAGDTQAGDVTLSLSAPEKSLVSKWPTFFRALTEFLRKYQYVVWPLVFVAFVFLFKKRKGAS